MIPLKFKRVEIRRPRYDPRPESSTTDNSDWRQGLFIIFEDYRGNIFDYMPKWSELAEIDIGKNQVELVNKELARKNMRCKK